MTRKILFISTTTHAAPESTSVAMMTAVADEMKRREPLADIRAINADKLHIVKNLSCYANGKKDCANPEAGPYRCWAHYESVQDPAKFGGVDQMPVIYDALVWADVVVWGTSTRWGSHSALLQKIIERMNTLENRCTSYGEPNPLKGKRAGVVVAGLHWKTASVALHLAEVFSWFGFRLSNETLLWWQRSNNPCFEHPDSDKPYVERWLETPSAKEFVSSFVANLFC